MDASVNGGRRRTVYPRTTAAARGIVLSAVGPAV